MIMLLKYMCEYFLLSKGNKKKYLKNTFLGRKKKYLILIEKNFYNYFLIIGIVNW